LARKKKKKWFEELRFETVGPSIGPELVKKTVYAIVIAAGVILIWVAYQFKNFKFGVSAILAMFHDSFILIGTFSVLGRFFNAEIDFLFVTALLTTLSFSVHDTIVVFDRIREIGGKNIENLEEVGNQALTETMVRSLNNSFTIAFMLVALVLLGGSTIRWFAVALLVGTILGTYSSPFVAVPLLVSWDGLLDRVKTLKERGKR
jgi:preprotein translocase subunit SecF